MRLSDRLETVVSMVRPAESAADIGTDHGHVPVELVRRGTVKPVSYTHLDVYKRQPVEHAG